MCCKLHDLFKQMVLVLTGLCKLFSGSLDIAAVLPGRVREDSVPKVNHRIKLFILTDEVVYVFTFLFKIVKVFVSELDVSQICETVLQLWSSGETGDISVEDVVLLGFYGLAHLGYSLPGEEQ